MNQIFAENINCITEDGTELENVTGLVIDNKRAYKASDGTFLNCLLYTSPSPRD